MTNDDFYDESFRYSTDSAKNKTVVNFLSLRQRDASFDQKIKAMNIKNDQDLKSALQQVKKKHQLLKPDKYFEARSKSVMVCSESGESEKTMSQMKTEEDVIEKDGCIA